VPAITVLTGLVLAGAAAVLVRLALGDLLHRRLRNRLIVWYAGLCPVALLTSGASGQQWLQHGLVAVVGFLVLLALFAARIMGGGDVKLGTAVLAWTGGADVANVLLVISVSGLIVALMGLLLNAHCLRRIFARGWRRKIRRALRVQRGVPYGVALAMGGLFAMPGYLAS
jgi:prepilin peptidase CpaA